MGLLDGLFGGGDSPPVNQQMPQIDPRLLMLSSMAAGVAPYMGASRLPHSTGQALAGAASGIGPGLMQGYQAQQAGLNNAMVQQQFQMLSDALQGKGAFAENGQPSAGAGGGGSPAPGVPVDASAAPGSPQSTLTADPNSPGAELRPTQGGLLGGGGGVQVAQNGAGGGTASDAPPSLLSGGGAPSAAPASGGQTIQPTAGIRRDVWGLPLPPGLTKAQAYLAAKMNPDGYKAAMAAMYADHRPGNYYRGDDMQMHQAPAAPMSGIDPSLRVGSPEYDAAVTRLKAAEAQGGVGSAIQVMTATQRAEQAKQEALARQAYKLKTGQDAPGDINAAPRTTGGPLSAGGPSPVAARMPAAGSQPGAQPGAMPSASPQNAGMKGEDFRTDRGTVVPSPKNQTIKQGEIQYKNQADASQKTEENWNAVVTQIPTTRARVLSTAKVLAQTQSGGLNEAKAEASKVLSGLGMDWAANKVMSSNDRAGVQTILWNSMQESLAYLKTANAGTGGRILNSEFNAFLEHGYSPDMDPKALREGMTQLLGGSYQTGNMIEDWHGPAQKMNWQDANQFQTHYLRKNPLESFISYADKEMPTFKGMEAGPKPGQGSPYSRAEIDAELARRKAAKAGGS